MVRHGGSSAGSYFGDHTSPIPFHCASIVVTSTLRVKMVIDRISTMDDQHVDVTDGLVVIAGVSVT